MMAAGRRISANEAMQLGVVSRVVPAADLDAAIDETVEALLAFLSATLAFGKEAFYAVADMDIDTALDYLQIGLTALGMIEDSKEGVAAFREKRDPKWTGHGPIGQPVDAKACATNSSSCASRNGPKTRLMTTPSEPIR